MTWTPVEWRLAKLNVCLALILGLAFVKAMMWVDQTSYRRGVELRNSVIVYRGLISDYKPRRRHGRVHRKQG